MHRHSRATRTRAWTWRRVGPSFTTASSRRCGHAQSATGRATTAQWRRHQARRASCPCRWAACRRRGARRPRRRHSGGWRCMATAAAATTAALASARRPRITAAPARPAARCGSSRPPRRCSPLPRAPARPAPRRSDPSARLCHRASLLIRWRFHNDGRSRHSIGGNGAMVATSTPHSRGGGAGAGRCCVAAVRTHRIASIFFAGRDASARGYRSRRASTRGTRLRPI